MFEEDIQNNKLSVLGKLTAGLFHEIRNPLSVVKLNLEFLKLSKEDLTEETMECVISAYEALERMEKLVNTVMDFSRKNTQDEKLCSISEINAKAVEILSSTAATDNISIVNKIPTNIPNIYFNKNKFLQILLNLLTNAIEACSEGGIITISSEFDTQCNLIIKITDDGCGISAENKEKIFQDFYTSKKKGTGIGLSVCKRILSEYSSNLYFESSPGLGSTFYIAINSKMVVND